MQTMNLQIEESFLPQFKNFIDSFVREKKVKIINAETSIDTNYENEKKMLNKTLEAYLSGTKEFTPINKKYWSDTRSRLVARHNKA